MSELDFNCVYRNVTLLLLLALKSPLSSRGLPGVTLGMLSNGPVSYWNFDERNELKAVRSDASTRVTLPATGSPPALDRNVVNGRVSSCFSKLPNANSLFFTTGPPAQTPVTYVLNVPGLTV